MSIIDAVGKSGGNVFNRTLGRLFGAGLNQGAESAINRSGEARWSSRDGTTDWRVRLTLAPESPLVNMFFGQGADKILSPLGDGGVNGIIFPLTPSVILQHQASYNPLAMTHSNQPHYAYQHSEVSSFTVVADFPVQNKEDARHWVATLHFLRSVTKMFFGGTETDFKGNPPPILQFNGYGNYVFKNIPVVVTNFSVELTSQVDYICTTQGADNLNAQGINRNLGDGIDDNITFSKSSTENFPETWAPTMSIFTMQLQPVYSRDTIKNFSMRNFVSGKLSPNSEGIGII
jgi:hypothetical protein